MNNASRSSYGLVSGWNWRRATFSFLVVMYLGWLALITALLFLPDWLRWLPYNLADTIAAMGHFTFTRTGDTHDLVHELIFALMVGAAAVGLLVQLRNPVRHIAGQLVALIAWGTLVVVAAMTNNWVPQPLFLTFGGLTLLATVLHPAGRGLFGWAMTARVNRALLALVIIAAVPLLMLAFTNIGLQVSGGGGAGFLSHRPPSFHSGGLSPGQGSKDSPPSGLGNAAARGVMAGEQEHAALGHYRNIAALGFSTLLIGILASFRPPGWRLAAWISGALPVLIGIASVMLPDAESRLSLFWSIAAILWGVALIATAERMRKRNVSTP